ncbi:restriction endonuclease subunit S [Cronobacter sakazakii]|nr:restriction endonuclease subunit S [Cronobacter sakazakii]
MSELSYLEKLLDGVEVEWLPLGEITKYEQPTKYLVKAKDYHDTYTIPVLTAGKTFILGYTNETHGIYQASKAPVIIFDDFTTANKWVDFDFKAKSSAMKMVTSCDDNKTLLKYVYYWLNTLPSEFAEGDHKRQWISNYSQKKIPIPCPENPGKSLAIQSEIVRILDKFTALTAELTAELTMRKKQYNYYRDQLLSFDEEQEKPIYLEKLLDGVEVEWLPLSKVFNLRNGYTPSKTKKEFWANGDIPWFRMDDIRENGRILGNSLQKISSCAVKGGKLFPENSILISTSATIGEHALITVPHLANQRFTCLALKESYADCFDIKFLFYYCFSLAEWCRKNTTMSSFASVDMDGFKKFLIPRPCPDNPEKSLAIQSEIVRILDKFDTLTNSITEGLPREIELRQKQYEYYRDLLFSFPKPETVSN